MSLRLLAVNPILDQWGNPPSSYGNPDTWGMGGMFCAYPNVGLIYPLNNALCRMTLDGVFCNNADFSPSYNQYGYDPVEQKMLAMIGGPLYEFELDPTTLAPQSASQQPRPPGSPAGMIFNGNQYARVPGGRIATSYYDGSPYYLRVYFLPDGSNTATQVFQAPNSVAAIMSTYPEALGPGRSNSEVFIGKESAGAFFFYNYATNQITSPIYYLGTPCIGLQYITELGVVAAILGSPVSSSNTVNDGILAIFAMEVVPATLSAPVLLSGKLEGGFMAVFQVTLLGAQSDPAEGYQVNWSITSGPGTLASATSTTDSNGNATCSVLYGFADSGPMTLEASVVC